MKIHIAARHDDRRRARQAAKRLSASGHEVVSRWLGPRATAVTLDDEAKYLLNDVVAADCLLLFGESPLATKNMPGSCDRYVELGYALKAGKRVCMLGPRETLFCHLPEVERYRTLTELIDGLR